MCFKKAIAERGLCLRVQVLEGMDDTNICVDWRVYKSILYHIFSNAVKFCDTKGKLSLEITYEEMENEDMERFNAGDTKFGFIQTKVLNTGEGIDK
jgi:signal transduction histidine kinase